MKRHRKLLEQQREALDSERGTLNSDALVPLDFEEGEQRHNSMARKKTTDFAAAHRFHRRRMAWPTSVSNAASLQGSGSTAN